MPACERDRIAAYLEHVASVEVGTMLDPEQREIVSFCASWVRNRLDEKWAAEVAEMEVHRELREFLPDLEPEKLK